MSVKGIFKTLVGTVVVMVLISLIGEYINIATNSALMKGIMMRSINKACDYFAQETYKEGAMGDVVGNMPDLRGRGGTIAGIGNFFIGTSADAVYDSLYRNSSEFNRFMANNPGEWRNLDMLYYGLYNSSLAGGNILTDDQKELGKTYAEYQWTPLNLGIAYLDPDVLERVMRYNIVQTLSNGNPNNIYNDVAGSPYVLYNGFKIYYMDIQVIDIEYVVYHTDNADEKQAFEDLTNIDIDSLGLTGDSKNICVAFIKYAMPLSYQGVTPLKRVMEYVWNNEVKGMGGSTTTKSGGTFNDTYISTITQDTSSGTMPVDGEIIFYIIN